jgi:hypothetical protein
MGWWRTMGLLLILPLISMPVITNRILRRAGLALQKRIDDLHSINLPAVLHILRQQNAAAGLSCHEHDKCIPK